MNVNELEFFERLRLINSRLSSYCLDFLRPSPPPSSIEEYQTKLDHYYAFYQAVSETQKELEYMLSLVNEDYLEVIVSTIYNYLKKDIFAILKTNEQKITPLIIARPKIKEKTDPFNESKKKKSEAE